MIKRDEQGNVTAIVCSRPKKCSYCQNNSVALCDYPKSDGKTCDAPLCQMHRWHPKIDEDKDYCRIHRRKIEEPTREASVEKKRIPDLVFIASSKYSGYCREKDCGARWSEGDKMWWDSKTKLVYCDECGTELSG